jgi:MFS transporter, MHS family, shikimate and dehydroshikimate transport protein
MAAVDVLTNGREDANAGLHRVLWSSMLGTAVEWYDFLIYGVATALVFNKLFFSSGSASAASIAAFGTLAVGYLARPLGAIVFGHFGDRVGRKAMLVLTISIMGLGTFLIGALPTLDQIGVAAPILLVALRFLQGIGLGGEWGGAVLMVVENAPRGKRGFLASIVQIGNPIGNLLAVGVFRLVSQLPEADFLSWGWRLPFLVSIVMVGIALFIRAGLEETASFRKVQATNRIIERPFMEIITKHPGNFFTAVALKTSEIAYANIAGVFVISYATANLKIPRDTVLNGVLLSSLLALVAMPAFGWLSDRIGRRAMFLASCAFSAAFAFPLFSLLATREPLKVVIAIVLAIVFGQMVMFSVGAAWYCELFPARMRYTGASLGFQVGAALSGGLSPLIAASLVAWSGGPTWPVSIFLIACASITATAAWIAPETSSSDLD